MSYNYQDAPMESQQEYFGKVHPNTYKGTLTNALKRIEELEAQTEKMKCCGNCKYSNQESTYSIVCKVGGVDKSDYIYTDDNQVCDKWEIREND